MQHYKQVEDNPNLRYEPTFTESKPTGGPSSYYDFPYSKWVTGNDQMEYMAAKRWLEHSLHIKDIFKACLRWGSKVGTGREYDAKKIVYSGLRLLVMLQGKQEVEKFLGELKNDPQFKG